jgi:hypothetical protein
MQLKSWLFGKQVKAFPFVLSLSKDERESRVGRQPSPIMLRQAQHERLKLQARFWAGHTCLL